jgi:Fatty acid desaturase
MTGVAERVWLTQLRSLRYGLMNALLLFAFYCLLAGGLWPWVALATTVFLATAVDEAAGDDRETLIGPWQSFLDAMLYLTLPLVALNSLALAHLMGHADPLGFGWLLGLVGINLEAARSASSGWSMLGGIITLGLLTGASAINVAHELVHRTENPTALAIARWLLAFACDTTFAIEHVYGHHRTVATQDDPASARRGEYVLAFAWRSIRDGNISAFRIEAARLARKGLPVWSLHNRALTWQAASAFIAALWWLIAGWSGLAAFFAVALQAKLYLEAVNYIEHYGLVRLPGTKVEARHSWSVYRGVSNALLYNLPRHASHHMYATRRFWQLEADDGAPMLPFGYMTSILATFVPPLWHRVIDARLAAWDRDMASPAERAYLAERGLLSA